jgi:hypothetical protein
MRSPDTPGALPVRCSDWARAEQVDAGGTAGSYAGFIVVEWPHPWPRDAGDVPELAGVAAAARERHFRLQLASAATDDSPRDSGSSFVASYRWNGAAFSGRELTVATSEAPIAALELLSDPSEGSAAAADDVLVCGHGRRDRCCGSLGTVLALEYASRVPEGVRLWRTSHTGGHRFAPTALLLPSGTLWAYLDTEMLDGIVRQRLDPREAARHYRGCAGLPSREVQVLERAVFAELGWAMFTAERHAEEAADGSVRLVVRTTAGSRTFEGEVAVRRSLPVPDCGSPVSAATKTEEELGITSFREVRSP